MIGTMMGDFITGHPHDWSLYEVGVTSFNLDVRDDSGNNVGRNLLVSRY